MFKEIYIFISPILKVFLANGTGTGVVNNRIFLAIAPCVIT